MEARIRIVYKECGKGFAERSRTCQVDRYFDIFMKVDEAPRHSVQKMQRYIK